MRRVLCERLARPAGGRVSVFITRDLDSRAPVRNAEELLPLLPNARLIVVENAGHDLNWVQAEQREAWGAFLAGSAVG